MGNRNIKSEIWKLKQKLRKKGRGGELAHLQSGKGGHLQRGRVSSQLSVAKGKS